MLAQPEGPIDPSIDMNWNELNLFIGALKNVNQRISVEAAFPVDSNSSTRVYSAHSLEDLEGIVLDCISKGAGILNAVFAISKRKRGYKAVTGIADGPVDNPTFVISSPLHGTQNRVHVFNCAIGIGNPNLLNLFETFGADYLPVDLHIFQQCRVPLPGVRGCTFDKERLDRQVFRFDDYMRASQLQGTRKLQSRLSGIDLIKD